MVCVGFPLNEDNAGRRQNLVGHFLRHVNRALRPFFAERGFVIMERRRTMQELNLRIAG